MTNNKLSVFIIVTCAFFMSEACGANFGNESKILSPNGATDVDFGYSVSISNSTIIVSSLNDDENGNDAGAAYIFVRDHVTGDWVDQQKLLAFDGSSGDKFGYSVSISKDTVVIGSRYDWDGRGSAYIFVRNDSTGTWTHQAKLTASDAASDDWFGLSVSIHDNTVVIGAPGGDGNYAGTGAAYVFVRDSEGNWYPQEKLMASSPTGGDRFGQSVSIDGNSAIIGAYNQDTTVSNVGAAYIFVRDNSGDWTEQQMIMASDGLSYDWFGYAVSISSEKAIVGNYANYERLGRSLDATAGAAYIFERDNGVWTEQVKLTASDGTIYDWFGESVSISADTAMVGWPLNSAYIYTYDTGMWSEQNKLTASSGFGDSVCVSGDTAIVGARGSAFVYTSASNRTFQWPMFLPAITNKAKP